MSHIFDQQIFEIIEPYRECIDNGRLSSSLRPVRKQSIFKRTYVRHVIDIYLIIRINNRHTDNNIDVSIYFIDCGNVILIMSVLVLSRTDSAKTNN